MIVTDLALLHDALRNDEPWREQAACRGVGTEVFYGNNVEAARRVCRTCPVSEECLISAIERGDWFGVQGGASERERKRIACKMGIRLSEPLAESTRKPIPHGTDAGYNGHQRHGIPPCDACIEAHRVYVLEDKRRRRERHQLAVVAS